LSAIAQYRLGGDCQTRSHRSVKRTTCATRPTHRGLKNTGARDPSRAPSYAPMRLAVQSASTSSGNGLGTAPGTGSGGGGGGWNPSGGSISISWYR
jgi:hypothetical protein